LYIRSLVSKCGFMRIHVHNKYVPFHKFGQIMMRNIDFIDNLNFEI